MSITVRTVSPDKLAEPQFRLYLTARDAFIAAGGSDKAASAAEMDESGKMLQVIFYKDSAGQQLLARVRFGKGNALGAVEWL